MIKVFVGEVGIAQSVAKRKDWCLREESVGFIGSKDMTVMVFVATMMISTKIGNFIGRRVHYV